MRYLILLLCVGCVTVEAEFVHEIDSQTHAAAKVRYQWEGSPDASNRP